MGKGDHMFRLGITTDGAAFDTAGEIAMADMLCALAERVRHGETRGTIRDENGNTCGTFEWVADADIPSGRHSRV